MIKPNQELLAKVVHDRISIWATKASLHVLCTECIAREALCELALAMLDPLCTCTEGCTELVAYAVGVTMVRKKVLWVLEEASERAVCVLWSMARHVTTSAVLQEMA